jgi:hypothetical protein
MGKGYMRNKTQKFAAALVTVMMLAGAVYLLPGNSPAPTVFAEGESGSSEGVTVIDEGDFSDGLRWTLDSEGLLTVEGNGSMTGFNYGETPWWGYRSRIRTAVIGDGVKNVGDYAFYMCRNLTEVSLPESVTRIDFAAFDYCTSLPAIRLPSGLLSIGDCAFTCCEALTEVTLPDGVTVMGESVFNGCSSLRKVNIPRGVSVIPNGAFAYCTSLEDIERKGTLTEIGDGAFSGCGALKSFAVPGGVKRVGAFAFSSCGGLTAMSLPDSVEKLGEDAFAFCGVLASVRLPSGLREVPEALFYECAALAEVNPPDSVTVIGKEAFYGCSSLKKLHLPDSLSSLGEGAFSGCVGLTTLDLSSACQNYTFSGGLLYSRDGKRLIVCLPSAEGTVKVNGAVREIAPFAFCRCGKMTAVTLPEGLEAIGENAFVGCSSLRSVDIPDGVNEISPYAFSECSSLVSASLPSSVKRIGGNAFSWCESLISAEMPDGLEAIGESAFFGCSALKTVRLPDSLTGIENYAFGNCGALVSAALPAGLTQLGEGVFTNCGSLVSVNIPEGVTEIRNGLFAQCTSLRSVIIPRYVTDIEAYAFYGCAAMERVDCLAFPGSLTWVKTSGDFKKNKATVCHVPSNYLADYRSRFSGINVTFAGDLDELLPELKITSQPQDVLLKSGESATFSVKATGRELTYQWYYRKKGATEWSVWKNRTTPSTTATSNDTWDGMQVYCKVTDADGKTADSQAATITIEAPITITSQPQDVLLKSGESVTFAVKATGRELTYQWYYRKKGATAWSVWKNRTTPSTTATSNDTWDGMQVYCKVTDADGKTADSDPATITIEAPITITSHPQDVSVRSGESVTFAVKATGRELTYQWYYRKKGATAWSVWKNRTTSSTTATSNDTWDGMQVYCKVTDADGKTADSQAATITIEAPITITYHPQDVSVRSGEYATFSVKATGKELTYQWYYRKKGATEWSVWKNRTTPSTTATSNDTWDGMQVYCKVTDADGKTADSQAATITIEAPITITSHPQDVSVRSGESVTFAVKATGRELTYQWYYRKKGATAWSIWKNRTIPSTTATSNDTWDGMQVYCKVTDADGRTENSQTATVRLSK